MFDVLLIYKILRHFVPQNDSVVFTEKDFVYDLSSPGLSSGAADVYGIAQGWGPAFLISSGMSGYFFVKFS